MNYPINLKADYIKALVIGAGSVALRKIETLLNQGITSITVIDKNISSEDFEYRDNSIISYFHRAYEEKDLENKNLVFIATNNKELNSAIALSCNEKEILCNVITCPSEGNFSLPALVKNDNLLIGISTSGFSPALSRALKEDIETFLDLGYADFVAFLGRLRPLVLALDLKSEENASIFRFFVEAPQKDLFLAFYKNKSKDIDITKLIKDNFSPQVQEVIFSVL